MIIKCIVCIYNVLCYQVVIITHKSEDEVAIALHDNELDIALTIEALLEGPQVNLTFE